MHKLDFRYTRRPAVVITAYKSRPSRLYKTASCAELSVRGGSRRLDETPVDDLTAPFCPAHHCKGFILYVAIRDSVHAATVYLAFCLTGIKQQRNEGRQPSCRPSVDRPIAFDGLMACSYLLAAMSSNGL